MTAHVPACEIRAEAWKALARPGAYWTTLAALFLLQVSSSFIVMSIVLVLVAFGVLSTSAGFAAPDDILALASSPFVWSVGASLLVAAAVLTWLIGFVQYGQSAVSLAAHRGEVKVGHAFAGWGHGWSMAWAQGIAGLYVFLWSLLFIIPGICAALSYFCVPYLRVDHPDWTSSRCIAESKRLMYGSRWRLIRYGLSYFGWFVLAVLVAAIPLVGQLLVWGFMPLFHVGFASFYEDLLDRDETPVAAETDSETF